MRGVNNKAKRNKVYIITAEEQRSSKGNNHFMGLSVGYTDRNVLKK